MNVLPLSGETNSIIVEIAGVREPGMRSANLRFVEAHYFETLQIPLLSGRPFSERDKAGQLPCAIVNNAFVRTMLQGRDPYTSEIRLGWDGNKTKHIVGVIAAFKPTATSPATGRRYTCLSRNFL